MRRMTILCAILLAGCGGGSETTAGDTSTDTGLDTGTDMDADVDAAGDAGDDPVTDADAEADTAADAPGDGEADAAGDALVGDPCTSMSDCAGAATYPTCLTFIPWGSSGYVFPGGYCSGDCMRHEDCSEGAECVRSFGGMYTCLKTCTEISDCREDEGYVCRARHDTEDTYCMPPRPPRPDAETDAEEDAADDGSSADVPAD